MSKITILVIHDPYAVENQDVAGMWFKSYDPKTEQPVFIADEEEALTFDEATEALKWYRQVNPDHPVRLTDGKPNRPLTAYSCLFAPKGTHDKHLAEGRLERI